MIKNTGAQKRSRRSARSVGGILLPWSEADKVTVKEKLPAQAAGELKLAIGLLS